MNSCQYTPNRKNVEMLIADWLIPARKGIGRVLALAAVGGLAMTAWDLVMDPVMVHGGHWVWDVKGAYFGIPLQNFWGWWLTIFVTFAVFLLFNPATPKQPGDNFDRLAIIIYGNTGLGNTVGALLVGLGGPALVGLFAMAPWVVLRWLHVSPISKR